MKIYKIAFAAVAALGITSLAGLAMHLSIAGFLLVIPGIPIVALTGLLSRSDSFLVLPLSLFLGYFFLALAVIFLRASNLPLVTWRKWTLRMVFPCAVLTALACVPTLDPMLPVGMTALKKEESLLASRIHDGDSLSQVEGVLSSQNVTYNEYIQNSEGVVFSRGKDEVVHASAGDRVLVHFGSTRTDGKHDASLFVCGYDLEICLVFGPDGRLKQRYVGEFPFCP